MFAATANHLPSIQFAETYNTICRIAIVGGVGKARRVHACSRDSHPQQNKTELARKFEATAFNLVSSDSRSLGALRPAVAEEIDRDRERERARARARVGESESERERGRDLRTEPSERTVSRPEMRVVPFANEPGLEVRQEHGVRSVEGGGEEIG